MSAPAREPFYYNLVGEPDGAPVRAELRYLIDDLAGQARRFPDWVAGDIGIPVRLELLAHEPGERAVIGVSAAGRQASLELTPDVSGWMLIVGRVDGSEVFRAYLDRPYEEFEFWPDGARPGRDEEAPGRVGKSKTWVSLHASVWPQLRSFANELGGVNFEIDEERLREAEK